MKLACFVPVAALCVAGACSSAGGTAPQQPPASAIGSSLPTYSYALSGGDRLRISVFGVPELSGDFSIGGSGFISLPLIGEVEAKGLTSTQLQARVAAELAAGYVNDPRVTIEVLTARPFYILGEVNKPGEYAFVDGLTVDNAVAEAGGFTYRAKTKEVMIKHAGEGSATRHKLTQDTMVSPGDTIQISERWF